VQKTLGLLRLHELLVALKVGFLGGRRSRNGLWVGGGAGRHIEFKESGDEAVILLLS
jgi:hypothetical protein